MTLAALLPGLVSLVEKIIPDPQARQAAQLRLYELTAAGDLAELQGAINALVAESQGNWLQRSWRPLLMLTFGGLIVARWFGLVAPNLAPGEYLELWGIVKLGLGGYVIGRSGEKIAPVLLQAAQALKK